MNRDIEFYKLYEGTIRGTYVYRVDNGKDYFPVTSIFVRELAIGEEYKLCNSEQICSNPVVLRAA